jgi:MFS transporter, DHA1 family, multidrug resistance protein
MSRFLPAETWRRNQLVMTGAIFFVYTGFAFVLPFLPLFVRQLGVRGDAAVALWAGILIGVAPLLAGLLAPVWGRLGDRYGHKSMALKALLGYVALLGLSASVTRVEQLLVLRMGIGLFGGIGPLGLTMATAQAPRSETGKAVGSIQSAQILAAAVGPFAGGFLADLIGIRLTFLLTAALCATAIALVRWGYDDAPREAGSPTVPRSVPFSEILRVPAVLPLLVVLFLVNFIGRSFTPILPLYLADLGVPADRLGASTGLLISAYSVAAALSASGFGRASGRLAPRRLLLATLVGGALTVLPMALVTSFPQLLGLGVLLGLASGGSLTLCYTMGGLLMAPDRRATAFGFFAGAALFGGALSPTVAGLLARWDLRGVFYADAALYLLLVVALLAGVAASFGGEATSSQARG